MPPESALRDGQPAGYTLIETMRREADRTIPRRARHLDRMAHSAVALGFPFDRQGAEKVLGGIGGNETLRVRLDLSTNGRIGLTTAPFAGLPQGTIWRLAIGRTRLDAADPLRRHKTDSRAVYAEARGEFPADAIDEVVLLNGDGELAEGTITNLFVDFGDGVLATPPVEAGALPGVLRAELLDQGKAVEARLLPSDIGRARAVFVGNSLRGLIAARLESE
ncbi:aminotransferase class IV family protein [Mesorhizobium sp. YIM 152430]|uniref:aminotransferase class IV family protein n=1 Tax=Mesorhizobium sp. YIM 152430 TaxID=3031761 RepID=UPI0023DAADF9|nr:aminotransferase class IV family protein [Mesorhizobium sp. YIM 152430]MDF1601725.1 aminotransferase class IV family protein [Mesorhizobium sp. YIM 152430]